MSHQLVLKYRSLFPFRSSFSIACEFPYASHLVNSALEDCLTFQGHVKFQNYYHAGTSLYALKLDMFRDKSLVESYYATWLSWNEYVALMDDANTCNRLNWEERWRREKAESEARYQSLLKNRKR